MGLPVNNFTFWSYLESKNKEDWQDELKKIRQNFSLFGYIIHYPEAKDGFSKLLGERFSQLSRMTGSDFLFTAFVNPPENFNNSEEFHPGYYYKAEQIINSENILRSDLGSFYAISISEYLGINTASLPYIILTDDPSKNRFYFIELNRDNFFEVMSDLTFLASQVEMSDVMDFEVACLEPSEDYNYETLFNKDSKKKRELDELIGGIGHPVFRIKLRQSLAQALLKISYKLQKFALNQLQVRNILLPSNWEERVMKELEEVQKIEFQGAQLLHDYLKSLDKEVLKLDLVKSKENLLKALLEMEDGEFEIFKNCLEPNSLAILLDGALMKSFFKEEAFHDASPFILPFGKAFEKEMTYSLVHWIREHLAIDLPEYFYKYQLGKRAFLINDQVVFDYNQLRRKTTIWLPPMLGAQVHGLRLISNQKSIHPFKDFEDSERFLAIGNKIMAIRNQATHLGKEGASSLRAVIYKWKELWNGGYLEQLNQLKLKYKN